MSAVRATRTARPLGTPRASYAVPVMIAGTVLSLSVMLLVIGARSPYTHGNLLTGYDAQYQRTEQVRVGQVADYAGIGGTAEPATANAATRGARLFVTKSCATCHGLEARGSVGPSIVGADAATIAKRVRKGPGGMPRYDSQALSDDEIAAITAYLGSLAKK